MEEKSSHAKVMVLREDKLIAIKIFLTVFLISSFFFKPDLTFARFEFLTKSLAHHGTTWIDKVEEKSGIRPIDFLKFNGHTYIETTPGLSFIALASYLPYVIFLQSRLKHAFSLNELLEFKITQFMIALSTVILFTALLSAVFFWSLRRIGCPKGKAVIFSFLLYFGTPIIYYSLNVTNGQNILEASTLFMAFFILDIGKIQRRGLIFLSGLLCGLAVFVNITSLFFLPLFILIILFSKSWRNLLYWISGTLLGATPLLIYNQVLFSNLWRISYLAKYGSALSFHPGGSLAVAGILLGSPMVGLVLFSPFVIMILPMFRRLWANLANRLILFAVLIYIGGICIVDCSSNVALGFGNRWYLNQGGGGPRHLLPIIPFLLYTIASARFDLEWKKIIASVLIFISVIINTPGLFWSGGQPVFFNNLLVFCKNGFHSYMLDLIKDILVSGGLNTNSLSLFPLLTILGVFLCWIWIGNRWLRDKSFP